MNRSGSISFTVVALLVAAIVSACAEKKASAPPKPSPTLAAGTSLQDRIARSIIAASPVTDVSDTKARDAASEKLGQCTDLLSAAGEAMLWGGFDEKKGYDPEVHNLNWFSPVIWAKLYLSTMMFPGEYHIHEEGKYTVLEVAAKFRDSLDSGDYPYPFWHSPKKWQAYIDTKAIVFVFEKDQLLAAYRKAVRDPDQPVASKMWDGKWEWKDAEGNQQPRVSLYAYTLSSDNPHRANLDTAYRNLEGKFRAQNCVSCHAPDNTAKSTKLLMLNYPNQTLAGRHTVVKVLQENIMPPLDEGTGKPAGLHDEALRAELLELALVFEKEADAALKFETSKKAE